MLTKVNTEPTDELRIAILRLGRRIRAERVRDDITDTQLSVLFALWKDGPLTLGALSEHERITPPSANRTVNALVEAGLVTRSGSPDDGRKILLEATDAGVDIARETKRRRAAWLNTRVAALPIEQRRIVESAAPILRELADS
jgi:DNA-binding MarR family transcriptional regulator